MLQRTDEMKAFEGCAELMEIRGWFVDEPCWRVRNPQMQRPQDAKLARTLTFSNCNDSGEFTLGLGRLHNLQR